MRDRPRASTAPLARSPCRGDRFPRSMQEPRPRSRHLHAGHHLANQQAPARLIPKLQSIPGFDVNLFLRHVISGSLALAFVIHTCRAQGATFPRRSPPRLLTAAARGGLRPPPAQRPRRATRTPTPGSSISCTAPNPATLISYIQPPSNVRGTPPDDLRARRPDELWLPESHKSSGELVVSDDARVSSQAGVSGGRAETVASAQAIAQLTMVVVAPCVGARRTAVLAPTRFRRSRRRRGGSWWCGCQKAGGG